MNAESCVGATTAQQCITCARSPEEGARVGLRGAAVSSAARTHPLGRLVRVSACAWRAAAPTSPQAACAHPAPLTWLAMSSTSVLIAVFCAHATASARRPVIP